MQNSILLLIGLVVAFPVYRYVSSLRYNLAEAKRSGLPYVITPCAPYTILWLLTAKQLSPIIKLFPESYWKSWLDIISPEYTYRTGHSGFALNGEAYLIVSAWCCKLMTDNAEVIHQITTRRDDFPKDVTMYHILSQFGDSVLTTEGSTWRMHRKVTSTTFNEKNAALVFHESIRQSQGLIGNWTGPSGKGTGSLKSLESDSMRLTLNIISYVGFGLRLFWPKQTLPEDMEPGAVKYASFDAPAGHQFSFVDTIATLLDHLLMLLIVPSWFLRLLPTKKAKLALDSRAGYEKYMDELLKEKIEDARQGDHAEEGMDLMGHLARSSYGVQENGQGQANGLSKDGGSKRTTLTHDEIIGNAFIMFIAGHETTANAIHFTLLHLATNPASQRRLQKDIDELLGDSEPETWDYDSVVGPMMGSMLGACMNETLRLIPAVTDIPKVTASQDQTISMDGRKYVVPKNATISLAAVSVHRNPRYWPSRPSKVTPGQDNILDFVPERWFQTTGKSGGAAGQHINDNEAEAEDFGGYQGPDTSAQLFRPERGAYIPFSDGARACLGRRIAQVEIIAALAVVFRSYSLELAVDEWAGDEAVAGMDKGARGEVYARAQASSRRIIAGASSRLTLKLHGDAHVPVRVVPRGEERFVSWVEG